jgi:hypothetical protein
MVRINCTDPLEMPRIVLQPCVDSVGHDVGARADLGRMREPSRAAEDQPEQNKEQEALHG